MGKILRILGIIFLVIVLLIVIAGVYFYYFYVFKIIRVCISNEAENFNISCSANKDCVDLFLNNISNFKQLENMPLSIKEKLTEVFNTAIYCEQTCKIKKFYGTGIGNDKEVASCKQGEKEIKYEIRGKEGLEILKYLKQIGQL